MFKMHLVIGPLALLVPKSIAHLSLVSFCFVALIIFLTSKLVAPFPLLPWRPQAPIQGPTSNNQQQATSYSDTITFLLRVFLTSHFKNSSQPFSFFTNMKKKKK